MPIITMYRGAFSGGEEIAHYVANALNYRCVNCETLIEASRQAELPRASLRHVTDREPRWWDEWLENLRPYRITLQAAMCRIAQGGNVVYHGHLGHELLPGVRHLMKVLLTASPEFRLEQVKAVHGFDDASAQRYIERVDRARARRLRLLFDINPTDPYRYDLVVNIGRLGIESAGRTIVEASRLPEFQPTAESQREFDNVALAAVIGAELIRNPKTLRSTIRVQTEDGKVRLSGRLIHVSEDEVMRIVEEITGVTTVVSELVKTP